MSGDPFEFDADLDALLQVPTHIAGRSVVVGNDIENLVAPPSLIEGVMDCASTVLLYGPSGSYKSFLAQAWALSIATGIGWQDRFVHQGPVLYYVGEGFFGTGMRHSAWKTYHKYSGNPQVWYMEGCPNLNSAAGRAELETAVQHVEPVLTIIDTVARSLPGGAENESTTMSLLIESMDKAKAISNSTVLGVHHSGKDEDQGARGHSSLFAAMDTVLRLRKGELYSEKQKHHPDGETLARFKVVHVPPSLVFVPDKVEGLTANEQLIVDALRGLGGVAGFNDLKAACLARRLPIGSYARTLARMTEKVILVRDTCDTKSTYRIA